MKLTISKTHLRPKSHSLTPSSSQSSLRSLTDYCFATHQPRHFLPHSQQHIQLQQLIKLDCLQNYNKVSNRITLHELHQIIAKSMRDFGCRYELWLGYLCVHVCHHERGWSRREKIRKFVRKFKSAFQDGKLVSIILRQTIKRIQKHCQQLLALPSIPILQSLCTLYQRTLLLQFIPAQYSLYIIDTYLAQDGDIEQYVRLCVSLIDFVLNMNPVNQAHAIKIMQRPYMGVIEWPVVISNRHRFRAEGMEGDSERGY